MVCLALFHPGATVRAAFWSWVPCRLAPWLSGSEHWEMHKESPQQKNGTLRGHRVHVHRCVAWHQEGADCSSKASDGHCHHQGQSYPEEHRTFHFLSFKFSDHGSRWPILFGHWGACLNDFSLSFIIQHLRHIDNILLLTGSFELRLPLPPSIRIPFAGVIVSSNRGFFLLRSTCVFILRHKVLIQILYI